MDKRYYKVIDGKTVFYNGMVVLGDYQVFNPTEEQILEAGYQEWVPPVIPEPTEEEIAAREKEEEIYRLRCELEEEDYKIIKCAEAQLCGEELPYDIAVLHASREAKRARINELEEE